MLWVRRGRYLDVGGPSLGVLHLRLPVFGGLGQVLPVDHQPGEWGPSCEGADRAPGPGEWSAASGPGHPPHSHRLLPPGEHASPSRSPCTDLASVQSVPLASDRTGLDSEPRGWAARRTPTQEDLAPAGDRSPQGPRAPTSESSHLSGLGLGQTFLTRVRGQGQGDAAAAQQEAHLLAASVLQKHGEVLTGGPGAWPAQALPREPGPPP